MLIFVGEQMASLVAGFGVGQCYVWEDDNSLTGNRVSNVILEDVRFRFTNNFFAAVAWSEKACARRLAAIIGN